MKALALKFIGLFKYPSTYQAIFGGLTAIGVAIAPELQASIIATGIGAVSIIGFFFSDVDVKPTDAK